MDHREKKRGRCLNLLSRAGGGGDAVIQIKKKKNRKHSHILIPGEFTEKRNPTPRDWKKGKVVKAHPLFYWLAQGSWEGGGDGLQRGREKNVLFFSVRKSSE